MQRLLPSSQFEQIFLPLHGKRVGLLKMPGNVGDRMLAWATEQMLEDFEIVYGILNWDDCGTTLDAVLPNIDLILVAGGGNLGSKYQDCFQLRRHYQDSGLPIVVLPQSITDTDENLIDYEKVYLREKKSLDQFPQGVLAPDLALGFTPPKLTIDRDINIGIFIREDSESGVGFQEKSIGDPVRLCESALEYLTLAARCQTIYTDRLHFAICGLIAGTKVYLLPGSYHKNRSMYDTWLKDIGCLWCEGADDLPDTNLEMVDDKFTSLCLPQSQLINWQDKPYFVSDLRRVDSDDDIVLSASRRPNEIVLSCEASSIIDGIEQNRSLEEICHLVSSRSQLPMLEIGRDVQYVMEMLRNSGLLRLNKVSPLNNHGAVFHQIAEGIATPNSLELHIEEPIEVGGVIRHQAVLSQQVGAAPRVIWFESSDLDIENFSPAGDAFVLGSLLPAMSSGLPLRVKGRAVSKGLLDNLYEFQLIMHEWYPSLKCVEIEAEIHEFDSETQHGIAAFSGGVDSTFSILRQSFENLPYWKFNIKTALMVRGFDIFTSNSKNFDLALSRARSAICGTDCKLIAVNTNLREINIEWKRGHGVLIASALSLFNHSHSSGMIASTIPYKMLYPFGSNAITDRLLGSKHFKIVHDGAEYSRIEKLRYLSRFPDVINNLRFCYSSHAPDHNCGKCEKCITTGVLLSSLGMPLECYESFPNPEEVAEFLKKLPFRMRLGDLDFHDLHIALGELEKMQQRPEWYEALAESVEKIKHK